jgi:ACS family D-galactonate transporter-like MFS transporter
LRTLPTAVVSQGAGAGLPAVIYVISHAVVSEFVPVAQRGAILAIGNAFGTTAGLPAPYVMGDILQPAAAPAEGYFTGFFVGEAIMFVAGLIGVLFIRPEREIARFGGAAALAPAAA